MMTEFTVTNYRSFRDPTTLSLLATRFTEPGDAHQISVGGNRTLDVLPLAGIFGANASGKTNFLRALSEMRQLVLYSFRPLRPTETTRRDTFALDSESRTRPTSFQIDLVLNGERWQYGFEYDASGIMEEYAYHQPRGRRALAFERRGRSVKFGGHTESIPHVERLLGRSTLLLSVAGAIEHVGMAPLYDWFTRNLRLADSSNRSLRIKETAQLADKERGRVTDLLRAADLGISGVRRKPVEISPEWRAKLQRAAAVLRDEDSSDDTSIKDDDFDQLEVISLEHASEIGPTEFDLEDESLGTLVWLGLAGPVIEALDGGHVLVADELDASLHPTLVNALVSLFQRRETNPMGAQLIFNAHDVTLLSENQNRMIGRDQVWFTEKRSDGATQIYPLTDFKPRKEDAIERRYLLGQYGAVPLVNEPRLTAAAIDET